MKRIFIALALLVTLSSVSFTKKESLETKNNPFPSKISFDAKEHTGWD